MGSKANKKFLEEHPFCCLCGGSVKATTIEHAPPKVFFIDGKLPADDHCVPACYRCNNGSSQRDQVAALAVLMMATAHRHDVPHKYVNKLRDGVRNNAPDAYRAIVGGNSPPKRSLLEVNGVLRKIKTRSSDPALFRNWLEPWAAKQAYALDYIRTGKIVPSSARIVTGWATNGDIINGLRPDKLVRARLNPRELRQGRKSSGIQFRYKWAAYGEISYYMLYLQDASIVITGVFRDASAAAESKQFGLFATNAEKGIHRLNPPKTPHQIPA